MASPLDNSPRKLAVEHGLSISRVEMILKLKALEKQIEAKKGFLGERMGVQDLFMESMERLLGVKRFKTISEYRKTERLRNSESLRLKPVFATIEEHETLTPEVYLLLRLIWRAGTALLTSVSLLFCRTLLYSCKSIHTPRSKVGWIRLASGSRSSAMTRARRKPRFFPPTDTPEVATHLSFETQVKGYDNSIQGLMQK